MSIVLKHIWRNIQEKKLITTLIILSLVITGALLFVAISIADVLDTAADSELQSVTTIFILIFIVTSFMSVFVVLSSFKYIITLRIKTQGTLRSIGASKKKCTYLLILESVVYGFISGLLAIATGILMLLILGNSLSKGQATIIISPLNILITMLFCLILSPLCAYIPIKTSQKYSVKEVILQTHKIKEKKHLPFLLAGISLIIVGILFILIDSLKYEEWAIYSSLIFALAGFVMCIEPLVHYFVILLNKIFPNSFTVRNMKSNLSHNNIVVLLAIAVAVVFMINSANAILTQATDSSFNLYNYNLSISTKNYDAIYSSDDIESVEEIESIGIDNAAGVYYKEEVNVGKNIPLMNLYGMTLQKMNKYFKFTFEKSINEIATKTILLSKDYLNREGLKTGDTLTIKETSYKIAGVIKEFFNNGNVGIITESDFEDTFNVSKYMIIVATSTNPDAARDALRATGFTSAVTVADMLKHFKSINEDMFTTVDYIIFLSTTAGVFGVLNNLLIAFASKKRERALLRSIGMSQKKSSNAILIEAAITGFIGGLLGLLGGILLTTVLPAVFLVFEFPSVAVPLSPIAVSLCLLCSTSICVLASSISLIGNSKLNIVQTLREEVL